MRLDLEIVNRGLARSRSLAQSYIANGEVMVNGVIVKKPSHNVNDKDIIKIKNQLIYVSRGGLKLEEAIRVFGLSLENMNCLDIGSSTGGFTDCLLQHGAHHVYAVDVGSQQMQESLRNDKRITLLENTDIRDYATSVYPEIENANANNTKVDIITIDVSFISLDKIIPHLSAFCYAKRTQVIALVKPQFEVGRGNLNNRGLVIVTDKNKNDIAEQVYNEVISKVRTCFEDHGFTYRGHIESPVRGGDGNREFLMHISA